MKEVVINNVQEYRLGKSLTQEDFAKKIGVSRQTVIAIEKGNYTPSVYLALVIAKFFNTKVEDIFKNSYEK